MTSILDIAPPEVACKDVHIARVDKTLTVVGLSALNIAKLIKRFPKFRLAAANKHVSDDDMMEIGLDATPAIIAMGLQSYDQETEEMVMRNLTVEEQAELLEAVVSLTNPDAPRKNGPFQKARVGRRGATTSGRVQAGTSP